MSYYHYIACSRELMFQDYLEPPKAVYANYADYIKSEDFADQEELRKSGYGKGYHGPTPDDSVKLAASGRIFVFEDGNRRFRGFRIKPFPVPSERTEDEHFVAKQFSLPHLYSVCLSNSFLDFMCAYLHPDDRLESLSIFLGHGEIPTAPLRHPTPVSLQDYADYCITEKDFWKRISDQVTLPSPNEFYEFIPPRTASTDCCIQPIDTSDCICWIFRGSIGELWEHSKLRQQGLF